MLIIIKLVFGSLGISEISQKMNSYQQGNSGVNVDTFARMDLSGKLIIKVQLGDDIRRIPIHNEDITYDELVLMMQRVFRGQLSSNDDVVIKYKDEDADLITIFDSSDLQFAIQCSRILQLTLFVNGQPRPLQSNEARYIRDELRFLRDKVLSLMDYLEPAACRAPNEHVNTEADASKDKPLALVSNTTTSKEFDPLTMTKNEDVTPEEQRPGTPDSISSRSSSISHQKPQVNQQPANYGPPQLPGGVSNQVRPGQPASQYIPYPQSGPTPPVGTNAFPPTGQSNPATPKQGYVNPGAPPSMYSVPPGTQQTYPGYQPLQQPGGYQLGYGGTPPNPQSLYGQQQQPPPSQQPSQHLPPSSGGVNPQIYGQLPPQQQQQSQYPPPGQSPSGQYPSQPSPVMGMQAPPQGNPLQLQPGQMGNPYARVNQTAFQRPPTSPYPTNY